MIFRLRNYVISGLLLYGGVTAAIAGPTAPFDMHRPVHVPVTIVNGYAVSDDRQFFAQWMYDDEYLRALSADTDPARAASKHLVVTFEAALGRAVVENRVDRDIDAIIERYTTANYHQMDPNIPDGRSGLSAWFKAGGMHKGGTTNTPPPPIALIADRDSVAMILKLPPSPSPDDPKKVFPAYLISVFRVRDGRISAHYSSAMRGAYWCRINCGAEK